MFVYRVASRRYAADNSEGARLYGGRWNHPGPPVIYTSATRSLAALEVIVNNGAVPTDCRVVVIQLPDSLLIESVPITDLAEGWPAVDSSVATADLGTAWASSLRTAVLRVPSAVIPAEHNYILNPQHPDFATIQFESPVAEYLDPRLRVKEAI
jgi:RES domain-containing protein